MAKIYIILFFIFVSNNLHSQYYLELKKVSQTKSFKFFPGEKIRFKLKDDENFTQAYITGISEDKLKDDEKTGFETLCNASFSTLFNNEFSDVYIAGQLKNEFYQSYWYDIITRPKYTGNELIFEWPEFKNFMERNKDKLLNDRDIKQKRFTVEDFVQKISMEI